LRKLFILDNLDFAIVKHYLTSKDSIANYEMEIANGNIQIKEDNIIIIYDLDLYTKIKSYLNKIKLKTKLIKENHGTNITSKENIRS